jgi:hypothetical protein
LKRRQEDKAKKYLPAGLASPADRTREQKWLISYTALGDYAQPTTHGESILISRRKDETTDWLSPTWMRSAGC